MRNLYIENEDRHKIYIIKAKVIVSSLIDQIHQNTRKLLSPTYKESKRIKYMRIKRQKMKRRKQRSLRPSVCKGPFVLRFF